MFFYNNWKVVSFVLAVGICLSACRAEEQDRVLSYEPGVYKGKNADRPLSEKELADLRQRGKLQSD
tara:strand:+ start:242 stop:439 length:198 start_codon:yes stop_codon:yes gene_type:complete